MIKQIILSIKQFGLDLYQTYQSFDHSSDDPINLYDDCISCIPMVWKFYMDQMFDIIPNLNSLDLKDFNKIDNYFIELKNFVHNDIITLLKMDCSEKFNEI